ncbi:toprim domain-containing protein [Desulfosarcina widdelii]|uniref:toprim domain-containing protein n=1 Tax=Desulfosarcina widdelii TaxID=947919 RepID=UPI001E35387C|nr:toprim domain-containing protein [Desulfosarcina widdelii]
MIFNLPAVMATDKVLIVEGEKDATKLNAMGMTATTSPMGSSNWKPEYAEYLKGKHLAILPDNDAPGKTYLNAVLKSLDGVAASVRVVRVPVGKDVSDWIQAGAAVEQIRDLINQTPVYDFKEKTAGICVPSKATLEISSSEWADAKLTPKRPGTLNRSLPWLTIPGCVRAKSWASGGTKYPKNNGS